MKVFSIIVYGTGVKPVILSQASELSSFGFFKRGTIKEFILFVSREIISRTSPGN
jgi:synaptobrevin family protein YKT6